MVKTGLSAVIGSWKMKPMRRAAHRRISSSLSVDQVAALEQDPSGRDPSRRHARAG